jgi:dolichol-phosphate mannosyltransferase
MRGATLPALLNISMNSCADSSFRSWVHRYARFCIVGLSGVIVDMLILHILVASNSFHLNLSLAKFLAAELAMLNNFIWNDLWTFRSYATPWIVRSKALGLLRFNLICAGGILISVLILNAQVRLFHHGLIFANLISIVVGSLWNYSMSARFAWKVLPPKPQQ